MKKIITLGLTLSLVLPSLPVISAENDTETISYNYSYDRTNGYEKSNAHIRQMEKLDRGLVAVKSENGVYLSWRLFDSEDAIYGSADSNVEFVVYRDGEEIAVVKGKTNYTDSTAGQNYTVAPIINGVEWPQCKSVTVMDNNYFDIPVTNKPVPVSLPRTAEFKNASGNKYISFADADGNEVGDWRTGNPAYDEIEYKIGDCSVGDLDGDGEYEIVVKWDCGAKDNSQTGVTGTVYLDAYKLDGTFLWRVDLGKNIRGGAHYTQFLVYDFDGDGKAEMTCKTAPGSKGADGTYVTKAAKSTQAIANVTDAENEADYRNGSGYVLDGDEYLTVFNGETGNAVDTIYYPNQRVNAYIWGDTYGNRLDRFTSAVAYLDGVKPYAVYMRGYYFGNSHQQRQAACAVSFDGTRLDCKYSFDTYDVVNYSDKSGSSYDENGNYKGVDGYREGNGQYVGQGNHNCTVADVDNDGTDEVMTGALCYELKNDVLGVRWCTYLQHGDALHIGDYDPTHKGLEFYAVHEDGGGTNTMSGNDVTLDYGMSVIDPDTGEIILHEGAGGDTGRGIMANVGAGGYYQCHAYAGSGRQVGPYWAMGNGEFAKKSTSEFSMSQNFRVFWDGDVYDELLDGTSVTSWNGSKMAEIFNANKFDCVQVNGSKANPALQADLFGDWREELVYPKEDNTKLRVFTTTTPTNYKIKTLMHDPVYRSGVAAEQTAYNQPPHVGFYMGKEDFLDTKLIKDDENQTSGNEKTITASKARNEIGKSFNKTKENNVYLNYYSDLWGLAYFGFQNIANFDPNEIIKAEIKFTPTSKASANRPFTFNLLPSGNDWEKGTVSKTDQYPSISNAILSQKFSTADIKVNEELVFDITDYVKGFASGTTEMSIIAAVSPDTVKNVGAADMYILDTPKIVLTVAASATPDPNKTPRPTYNPNVTDKPKVTALPNITATPTVSPSATPTATPTVTPSATPTATPTVSPAPTSSPTPTPTSTAAPPTISPTEKPNAGYIAGYDFENKYAAIHCNIDQSNTLVIFASYDGGKLINVRTVTMDMQKDTDRKPRAKDFENGEIVKIFVWKSFANPEPIMEAKAFIEGN